ncbi:MAG: histidine phosphatase family protein [Desertimonas sp.]
MLILLRHGRTRLNAQGRLQGRVDEPLDEVGEAQAKAAAAHLGPVDQVISSPLRRARETAAAFGQPVEIDDRWVELSYGIYEGVPHAEVPSEAWANWKQDPDWVPEGGESLATLDARVRTACEDIRSRAADRDVVVVSHVSPIKAAVAWALGVGPEMSWRSHLSHASICRIDTRRAEPILVRFNEVVPP